VSRALSRLFVLVTAAPVAAFCFSLSKAAGERRGEDQMGILESAQPAIVICTRDRARTTAFYRETLGLALAYEDNFAAVFNTGGATLRVSFVAHFTPHEHTILGFKVPDVEATVRALREKGLTFNIYTGFNQDELGILTLPGGVLRVAWFKDPDGNVLSVTNA
jgi:catechol 2,3-dioxygenase-like lactoylglutathione lyase family enzyme